MDPLTGKTRVLVEEVDRVYSAMWSPDGRWVVYHEFAGEGLWVLNGEREPRKLATGTIEDWTWSPTAPQLAMVLDYSRLIVVDAWTGRRTDLCEVADPTRPVWTRDGTRVLYGVRGGSLYSVDVRSGERSLFVQLPGDNLDSMDEIEWSPDGAHLAIMNDLQPGGGRLYVMNADGSGVRILLDNYLPAGFAWSPDGTQLTYAAPSRSDMRRLSLWTLSLDGSDRTRLGSHLIECSDGPAPVWSPDGNQVAFRADPTHFFVINADGTGDFRRLNQLTYLSWSGGSYSATAGFGCLG